MEEYDESLKLYHECYKYYLINHKTPELISKYKATIFGLADVHKSKNNIDSTTYFNKLGYCISKKYGDEYNKNLFILNEGANEVLKKNYKVAIDSIVKALPAIKKHRDYGNVMASYYYLGKSYENLNAANQAIANYKKVDSINTIYNFMTPEFIDGYSYLIRFYQTKGDTKQQLLYTSKFAEVEKTMSKNYKTYVKKINQEYDLSSKNKVIETLNKNKVITIYIIISLLVVIISLAFINRYRKREYNKQKQIFENLIAKASLKKESEILKVQSSTLEDPSDKNIKISEDVILSILKKLDSFENEKSFLKTNITQISLAKEFETNSKYLTTVIKIHRGFPFIHYINNLRINFAIEQLQTNKQLLKYSNQALAYEFGFNSYDSFSNAFLKKTGVKPSFFIQENKNN